MEEQLTLFETEVNFGSWEVESFSFEDFAEQKARLALEKKYLKITEVSDEFSRQSVSYQLSKKDSLHRWLKYKEGFSSQLVNKLLDQFKIKKGELVLDPFLGSGTTSIVCQMRGINSMGYDILPTSSIAIEAKKDVFNYDLDEIGRLIDDIRGLHVPEDFNGKFNYITITDGAFPDQTEKDVVFITKWINESDYSDSVKTLVKLCILNCLEPISYTSKDGQFLGWDYRSKKMQMAAERRQAQGKKPMQKKDKGVLPLLKPSLLEELQAVYNDIKYIQTHAQSTEATINYVLGSVLFELPKQASNTVSGVITSPPYCNRYDYTRTYGLELNYLGLSTPDVNALRQTLLSCTVENRSKMETLKNFYESIGRLADYEKVVSILNTNEAFQEIKLALHRRNENGDINNEGVLRMVEGYFTELTFLFFEIYRVCKKGAHVAFVNDNVRYGGEVIPVDFLCTSFAEQIGFKPVKVYTLKQQKGNSSQQMKKYGRVPLRKSITVWAK